jgi:hypothetical protein
MSEYHHQHQAALPKALRVREQAKQQAIADRLACPFEYPPMPSEVEAAAEALTTQEIIGNKNIYSIVTGELI